MELLKVEALDFGRSRARHMFDFFLRALQFASGLGL